MVVAEDASGVAIREADLHGVVADDRGGFGARLGLKHRQDRKCGTPRGSCCGEGFFFPTLIVARGARTFFAQIMKIVVADVAVGPGDVNASAALYVHFHGGWFLPRIQWYRHECKSIWVGLLVLWRIHGQLAGLPGRVKRALLWTETAQIDSDRTS